MRVPDSMRPQGPTPVLRPPSSQAAARPSGCGAPATVHLRQRLAWPDGPFGLHSRGSLKLLPECLAPKLFMWLAAGLRAGARGTLVVTGAACNPPIVEVKALSAATRAGRAFAACGHRCELITRGIRGNRRQCGCEHRRWCLCLMQCGPRGRPVATGGLCEASHRLDRPRLAYPSPMGWPSFKGFR